MCGKQALFSFLYITVAHWTLFSGAYCAAVIISLLDLPLELPHDSPARSCDTDTLLTGVPEYVSRCKSFLPGIRHPTKYYQVKHMKAVYPVIQILKPMPHILSVDWHVSAYWAILTSSSQSKQ